MSKVCPLLTIGPTIPSNYLDNRVGNDSDYGLNLFTIDDSSVCTDWLNTKPPGSVVYVSFGSMACLSNKQMEVLALALKGGNFYFLWVVKVSEEEKLPENFVDEIGEKGLVVEWSRQVEVLSSGGWNSTLEALCLGVPLVVIPQWTDQTTNAKFVEDVWKVGVRIVEVDENGVVGREEIQSCIKEVMEGERGKEMKENAKKWSHLAIEAVSEGGTSDKNIEEFVSKLIKA
ncbi:flavonol 7-O-beta-glucosyltransferase UGT74F1-like [Corylus avellana]|uniref:flavonol 7-O-beta-glucosyltransferase UGT74F1-like n=1 Tax=Corylus avellana TaxID=13451 RepID=UPI00286B5DE3|nr:flavonol 7-O-beta-glucosyltransferase UGT74F1-like [Corylus avellana]